MDTNEKHYCDIPKSISHRVMLERGRFPDVSAEALAELRSLQACATGADKTVRDLRHILWASVDNEALRHAGQLNLANALFGCKVKILVPVVDEDSSVIHGLAIDQSIGNNAASVNTITRLFPMSSEKVSADITVLSFNADRLFLADEALAGADGSLEDSKIYRTWVHNCTKLACNNLADRAVLGIRHGVWQADHSAVSLGRLIAYCFIVLGVWLMFSGSFGTGLSCTVLGLLVKLIQEFAWNKIK
jgi:exoribonuclease R